MKAMNVYASRFGHNRALSKALAYELAEQGVRVICAPVSKIREEEVVGLDLLVLGTHTHAGQANARLQRLCEAIPEQQRKQMAVGLFSTQIAEILQADEPSWVDDLVAYLEARNFDIVIPPLRIDLHGAAVFLPCQGIGVEEYNQLKSFTRDLLEACVARPIV